jgi:transcriptional regulator with XRE-family HTH domain
MEDVSPAGLRTMRIERGMTLADICAAADISVSFLSRLERGEHGARPETMHAILAALDEPERSDGGPGLRKRARCSVRFNLDTDTPAPVTRVILELADAHRSRRLTPEASDVIRAVLEQCD